MMKKQQDQESISSKVDKLLSQFLSFGDRLAEAYQTVENEESQRLPVLPCFKEKTFDFQLIEQSVQQIHAQLEETGVRVLGSHLIIDGQNNQIQIQTYTRQNQKNFVNTIQAQVKQVINLPVDLVDELQKTGKIELHLNLEN